MRTDINHCFCEAPWILNQDGINGEVGGRSFVILPYEIQNVTTMPAGIKLPLAGYFMEENVTYKRFELPACSCDQIKDREASDSIQLRMYDASNRYRGIVSVTIKQNIDYLLSDKPLATDDEDSFVTPKAFLNSYIDHINNSFDEFEQQLFSWQGIIGNLAIRPKKWFLKNWQKLGGQDVPRMSLIVRLADKAPALIRSLANNPRRILQRQRKMLDVGSVQQIDQAGMRWLARQPGVSIVEKAGIKRKILAVTRIEHHDTPENRVVKDFIIRSISSCKRYLYDYKKVIHPRTYKVHIFLRLLRTLLNNPIMATVNSLTSIAKANYVLLHDARYNSLWKYYQMLIRQEMQQDNAWVWRHRLWAEMCQVSFENMLALISDYKSLTKPEVVFHEEHNAGKFMYPHSPTTEWVNNQEYQTFSVINNSYIGDDNILKNFLELYGKPNLFEMIPDFVVTRKVISSGIHQFLPVWCIFNDISDSVEFSSILDKLQERLSHIDINGIVMLPNFSNIEVPPISHGSHLRIVKLSVKEIKDSGVIFDTITELIR